MYMQEPSGRNCKQEHAAPPAAAAVGLAMGRHRDRCLCRSPDLYEPSDRKQNPATCRSACRSAYICMIPMALVLSAVIFISSIGTASTADTAFTFNATYRAEHAYSWLGPLRFSADGRYIVCGCSAGQTQNPFRAGLYALDGSEQHVYESPSIYFGARSADVSLDGQYVAAQDDGFRVWRRSSGALVSVPTTGTLGFGFFSPDSQFVAATFSNATYTGFVVLRVDTWALVSIGPNYYGSGITNQKLQAFSADGSLLYVSLDASGPPQSYSLIAWSTRANSAVASFPLSAPLLAMSVQGGWAACGASYGGEVVLVSLATGGRLRSLSDPGGLTTADTTVAASWDGRTLAVLYGSGPSRAIIRGWSTETGALLWNVSGIPNVNDIALSPDGSLFAYSVGLQLYLHPTGLAPSSPVVASPITDTVFSFFNMTRVDAYGYVYESFLYQLCFSADGRYIAFGSSAIGNEAVNPFRAGVYSIDGSEQRTYVSPTMGNWANSVNLSPDGQYLAAYDSALRIWRRSTGELLPVDSASEKGRPVVFSPDSQLIAVNLRNSTHNTFAVYRLATWALVSIGPSYISTTGVRPLAFSSNGSLLYVAIDIGVSTYDLIAWTVATRESNSHVVTNGLGAPVMALSVRGGWAAIGIGDNNLVVLLHFASKDPPPNPLFFETSSGSSSRSAVASRDGRTLAVLYRDNVIVGWSTETGAQIWNVTGPSGMHVDDLALSPDGSLLAYCTSGGNPREVKLVLHNVGSSSAPAPLPTPLPSPIPTGTAPEQYRQARRMCLASAGLTSPAQMCGSIGAL